MMLLPYRKIKFDKLGRHLNGEPEIQHKPSLVKFSRARSMKYQARWTHFALYWLSVDKHNTLSKQGLAFECYIHHLKTTKFVRQIAHFTLDLLIFPDHRKSKMILLILSSAQASRGTADPVYHKPDNAKVLIDMDFPFRERVWNFHDSNLLASFSIREFQFKLRKSVLDMVKRIPRTLIKSVLHFILTGPSVLPAIEPNHKSLSQIYRQFQRY